MKRDFMGFILIFILILSAFVVIASKPNESQEDKFSEKHCVQNASKIKFSQTAICHNNYKTEMSNCKNDFNSCKENVSLYYIPINLSDDKLRTRLNSSHRYELRQAIQDCRIEYKQCKQDSKQNRSNCTQLTISNFELAKDQCKFNVLNDCQDNSQCRFNEFCQKDACNSSDGKCVRKPMHCPDVYTPTCGCNNQTYGNTCFMNNAGINQLSEGECSLE